MRIGFNSNYVKQLYIYMVDGLEQFSIGNHDPNTDELIFFRGVETTNLVYIYIYMYIWRFMP